MSLIAIQFPDTGDIDVVSAIDLMVKVGDTVKEGSVVSSLEVAGAAANPKYELKPGSALIK